MESDDEEMRDASSSSCSVADDDDGDAGFEEEEGDGKDGVMVMEVRWFEVDLDYEYDAPRWFDLAQDEAPAEAAAAELWFATAPSYPPSPLIAMMLAEDLGLPNLRSITVADIEAVRCPKPSQCSSGATEQSIYRSHVPNEGRIPCHGASKNERKPVTRSAVKGNLSKGSTLMKPTASQLARQHKQLEVKNAVPSKKSVGVRSDRSTISSNDCTQQAGKRQKLEKGHLNKDVATNQHELIHKAHEKNVMSSSYDRATVLPKLKITVPREPELATKLRAERSRIQRSVPSNSKQLNRRDLQPACRTQSAPTRKVVQPFRAHQHANIQHVNVAPKTPVCSSNRATSLHNIDKTSEDDRDGTTGAFKFKALPLDKKILASRGDIGVFQTAKRNPTVPKEFNLSTSRKSKPPPLSELFNKLSLSTEACRAMGRQTSERPNYITTKDCKENMIGAIHC
ncbi:protein TPX2-like isoform X1 [Triticum dicoccoides]|uniref:protein TPX2-like isoform X1 n=1 Tax=Triticum dicoccoides TaxID=85692 RepID=UPI0018917517|nr:protein TPX2-like isoform X1 [Triticum dicoccoides]XP_037461120.1 protein TPX2-like isoform X1 [Triticum dicoccoides]